MLWSSVYPMKWSIFPHYWYLKKVTHSVILVFQNLFLSASSVTKQVVQISTGVVSVQLSLYGWFYPLGVRRYFIWVGIHSCYKYALTCLHYGSPIVNRPPLSLSRCHFPESSPRQTVTCLLSSLYLLLSSARPSTFKHFNSLQVYFQHTAYCLILLWDPIFECFHFFLY